MISTPPRRGSVIRYRYLWARESDLARIEGGKDRPSVVIAIAPFKDTSNVYVVAVTHTAPETAADAVPFPIAAKRRLGLDDRAAWIVTTEANVFAWPGPDIRPVAPGRFGYGTIPMPLLEKVTKSFLANVGRRRIVTRTS